MTDHYYLSREVPVVTKPEPVKSHPSCVCDARSARFCIGVDPAKYDGRGYNGWCGCLCHVLLAVSR